MLTVARSNIPTAILYICTTDDTKEGKLFLGKYNTDTETLQDDIPVYSNEHGN